MSLIQEPTKLELEGMGALTVRPSDYVTQGGEGAIYRKGDHILKLALQPKQLAHSGMPEKVRLLQRRLSHPSIIVPEGMVRNKRGDIVGMHLPYITGEPYPRLFASGWRNNHQFGDTEVTKLASTMHEVVSHAHQANVLLVDANELNWLADVRNIRQPVPLVIDVDSWQIDRFKATVVMPSIRDWHSPISSESDWFAWGVVTFLLYTGIHPYKGKLAGYKPGELERRMQDNASVFLPEVGLNKAVRDFGSIPGPLLDWYKSTFQDGVRTPPPSPQQTGRPQTTVGRVLRAVVTSTGGLVYEELLRIAGENIISVWPCGVVRTDQGNLVEVTSKKRIGTVSGVRVAVVKTTNGWLVAEEISGTWQFRCIARSGSETNLSLQLPVENVLRSDNRLFVTTQTELVELQLQSFSKPVLTTASRWQVLGNSTSWFAGVGVSDVLGAMHVVVPYGQDNVAILRVKELDGRRIVGAKAGGRIATITTIDGSGQYQVLTLSADKDWRQAAVSTIDVDGPDQNHAVLPKGVIAQITEDGELTIEVPSSGAGKVVKDKDLLSTMRLYSIADQVVYLHEGALWSLRMQ